jgi:hypothetical protein
MSPGPITYVVRKGDTLSGIARSHGFSDWKYVWNHKLNEAFRKSHKSPDLIFPGDKLIIPPKPEEEKGRQQKLQKVLETLRKLRQDTVSDFAKMEAEADREFGKIKNLGQGVDVAAAVATALIPVSKAAAGLKAGASAATTVAATTAVKNVLADQVLGVIAGLATPSWWANQATKWVTGEDTETAHKNACDLLQKTRAQTLANLDAKIKETEKLLKEAGG